MLGGLKTVFRRFCFTPKLPLNPILTLVSLGAQHRALLASLTGAHTICSTPGCLQTVMLPTFSLGTDHPSNRTLNNLDLGPSIQKPLGKNMAPTGKLSKKQRSKIDQGAFLSRAVVARMR